MDRVGPLIWRPGLYRSNKMTFLSASTYFVIFFLPCALFHRPRQPENVVFCIGGVSLAAREPSDGRWWSIWIGVRILGDCIGRVHDHPRQRPYEKYYNVLRRLQRALA
ncbi:hypothetical protein BDW72DRAFT_188352 [Aspergillus terricola var. indicus]